MENCDYQDVALSFATIKNEEEVSLKIPVQESFFMRNKHEMYGMCVIGSHLVVFTKYTSMNQ